MSCGASRRHCVHEHAVCKRAVDARAAQGLRRTPKLLGSALGPRTQARQEPSSAGCLLPALAACLRPDHPLCPNRSHGNCLPHKARRVRACCRSSPTRARSPAAPTPAASTSAALAQSGRPSVASATATSSRGESAMARRPRRRGCSRSGQSSIGRPPHLRAPGAPAGPCRPSSSLHLLEGQRRGCGCTPRRANRPEQGG